MIIASVFMLETLLCNIISKHNGNNAAANVMRHQTAIFELRIDLRPIILIDWLAESESHFLGHIIVIIWPINNVYTTVT